MVNSSTSPIAANESKSQSKFRWAIWGIIAGNSECSLRAAQAIEDNRSTLFVSQTSLFQK